MTPDELLPPVLSGMNAGEGAWAVRDAQGQIDIRTVSPTELRREGEWALCCGEHVRPARHDRRAH